MRDEALELGKRSDFRFSVLYTRHKERKYPLKRQQKPPGEVAPGMISKWPSSAETEEVLVADVRARLTPADMVDRKFETLLTRHPRAARRLRMDVPRDRARNTTR